MRTWVIYACLFGENATVVVKLAYFVAMMQEEEQMLQDYVPQDAALRLHVPYLLAHWVQIRFYN